MRRGVRFVSVSGGQSSLGILTEFDPLGWSPGLPPAPRHALTSMVPLCPVETLPHATQTL